MPGGRSGRYRRAVMTGFPFLVRSTDRSGQVGYRLGDPLVDRYLEFVAGRARPNTLRAVAFDLKTFFTVVARGPRDVTPAATADLSPSGSSGPWYVLATYQLGSLVAVKVCYE